MRVKLSVDCLLTAFGIFSLLYCVRYHFNNNNNKCIGDDTKAAARQSPNCIKKQKK